MEVSTSTSQSFALSAYAAQQQPQGVARDSDRDNEAVDANRATEPRRGDNVSFSNEAMRLSEQNGQDSRTTVNRANEGEAANRQQQQQLAAHPERARAAAAQSVAQAINAYRDTSVI